MCSSGPEDIQLSSDEAASVFWDQLLSQKSPFTTHGSVTHLVLTKVKQCVCGAFLYTNPSVLASASNQCTLTTKGLWPMRQQRHMVTLPLGGGGGRRLSTLPVSSSQAAPVTMVLSWFFSGLLLSLFASFLTLEREGLSEETLALPRMASMLGQINPS